MASLESAVDRRSIACTSPAAHLARPAGHSHLGAPSHSHHDGSVPFRVALNYEAAPCEAPTAHLPPDYGPSGGAFDETE